MAGDRPSWKYRRRATFSVLYFGAFVILFVLLSDDDRAVLETLVLAVAGLMGAALSVYTGAAAWQDVKLPQSGRVGRYSDGHRDEDGYGYDDDLH